MKSLPIFLVLSLALAGCGLDGPIPQSPDEARKSEQGANPASNAATAPTGSAGNAATAPAMPLGQSENADSAAGTPASLAEARRGFTTKLTRQDSAGKPVESPPPGTLQLVQYDAALGKLNAYLSLSPRDAKKHPAIVWITGGDCNTIDHGCWTEGPPDNEQSAAALRKSGIVVMFPSLRGGNDNPGHKEGMFGEVDDVVAAAEFLSRQEYIDPGRIYLGGHSSGGTLVLLVAECTDRFRAVFSFGPISSVSKYGPPFVTYDPSDQRETVLRAPGAWLHSIRKPTFVIEGAAAGNVSELELMKRICRNPLVSFYPVGGESHFSVLAPATKLIAERILKDTSDACNIAFSPDALGQAAGKTKARAPRR